MQSMKRNDLANLCSFTFFIVGGMARTNTFLNKLFSATATDKSYTIMIYLLVIGTIIRIIKTSIALSASARKTTFMH